VKAKMDLTQGIIALFGVAGAMVFFIGSLMLIKAVTGHYLPKAREDEANQWLNKRH
jgi:hypothetical protein